MGLKYAPFLKGLKNEKLWIVSIHLGAHIFEPQDLLEEYEYFNGKEWKPFGVEA